MCVCVCVCVHAGSSLTVDTPDKRGNSPITIDNTECEAESSLYSTIIKILCACKYIILYVCIAHYIHNVAKVVVEEEKKGRKPEPTHTPIKYKVNRTLGFPAELSFISNH